MCRGRFIVTFHGQCQLVKDFKSRINVLGKGIKCPSGMNLGLNGVDNTICQVVFLFWCMTNKQVSKYLPYGIMTLSVKTGM